jgi:hypothetical protein
VRTTSSASQGTGQEIRAEALARVSNLEIATNAELIANQNLREQVYPTTVADAGEP